jgi:23S rRNA (guanine1835-N2)-methyltransferase
MTAQGGAVAGADDRAVLDAPQGRVVLPTTSQRGRGPLRAWDAADELALQHLAEVGAGAAGSRVLVVGDRAGGLAIPLALAGAEVASLSDSWLAHRALAANLAANGLPEDLVTAVPRTAPVGGGALERPVDVLVVKVPRTAAELQAVLCHLRPLLRPGAVVVGAGMTRHVHASTVAAFAAAVGPTSTTRARKKARLLLADVDPGLDPGPPPPPATYRLPSGQEVISPAGVFAAGRLDAGTALLLAHLPTPAPGSDVVDLGCGDGVVGLALATAEPTIRLTCTDVAYTAVEAARATLARNLPDRQDRFLVGDAADPLEDGSADLVVVNPPSHDEHVEGDQTAWAMLSGARRVLRVGGALVVVAHRDLGHHARLSRLFGGHRTLGSDRRFVVLQADKRPRRAPGGTPA